jgi:hypothetical protein
MCKKVPVFHFQKLSDLIDSNSLFGCNRIYVCKSKSYKNLNFKTIAEVDVISKFTS